jgi:uncharacterized membrane protein
MLHFPLQRWTTAAMQRSRVADWITAGHLAPDARRHLDAHTDPWPTAPDWRSALNVGLLWLAALLIGVGIIMFIAANWSRAGSMLKVGGVEAAMLLCAVIAQWQRRKANVRDAALLAGALATGALLALVGQTYQTGADTAVLFGVWALAMLPWAVAGTTPILWLLWAAVLSLGTWLAVASLSGWVDIMTYDRGAPWPMLTDPALAVAALNLVLLAVWELASRRIAWLSPRLGPRCLAAVAIAMLSAHAVGASSLFGRAGGFMPVWVVWAVVLAVLAHVYYRVKPDLMMLAFIALSVLVVVTWIGSSIMFDEDFMFGLIGGAVLAVVQASIYTGLLRRLGKRWQS